jgi:hypothetical protein
MPFPSPTSPIYVRTCGKTFPVATLADASALFCATRDRFGEGASRTPPADVVDGSGNLIGHISYNGRIWAGAARDWSATTALLFDNRIVEVA